MRRFRKLAALVVIFAAVSLFPQASHADNDPDPVRFLARLAPDNEFNSTCDLESSDAGGAARFTLRRDRSEIRYEIVVRRVGELFPIAGAAAHIHLGAANANGPVVVPLPITHVNDNKARGEGTITAADLVGPLAGQDLLDLVQAMQAGNTYVNVHTVFCNGGEVRGQIELRGDGIVFAP